MSWDIALSEMETGDYAACVVLLIRKEIVFRPRGGARPFPVREAEGERSSSSSSRGIKFPLC